MTVMMYTVAPLMGVRMDIAQMLGSMLGNSWAAGLIAHFINGSVIFAALFAAVLYARLPGTPLVRGAVWGVVLWLAAQVIVMPIMGAGFFSLAAGGVMAAMASLVGHLVYGSLLGAVAGAPGRVPAAVSVTR
jgi:uncharacterized membrane protein YagU involved in acid resistance